MLSEPDKAALVGAVAARTDYISPPVGAEARSFAIVVPAVAWLCPVWYGSVAPCIVWYGMVLPCTVHGLRQEACWTDNPSM